MYLDKARKLVLVGFSVLTTGCEIGTNDHPKSNRSTIVDQINNIPVDQNKPLSTTEISEKIGVSKDLVEDAVGSSNITPTIIKTDKSTVVVPTRFFEQKLSVSIAVQSRIGERSSGASFYYPHIFVNPKIEGDSIELLTDFSHQQLSDLVHDTNLLSFKTSKATENSLALELLNPVELAAAVGTEDIYSPWIRSYQYKNNGEFSYIAIEASLPSPTGTINAIISVFPTLKDKRKYDPAAKWKVMSFLTNTFTENEEEFNKGVQMMPLTHNPDKPINWYLYTSGKKFLETEKGKVLYNAVEAGVNSWNIYGKDKDIVDFKGYLPKGVKVGEPGYSIIALERNMTAGSAYANFSEDPVTGLQVNSYVFLPTAWTRSGDLSSKSVILEKEVESKAGNNYPSIFGTNPKIINENREIGLELAKASKSFLKYTETEASYGAVKAVTMHEIGHTIGMRHNFKASNPDLGTDYITSVMDYTPMGFEIPLFMGKENGFINRKLSYDQAYVDVFYNELPANDIADLEQCTDQDTPGTNLIFGIDPFCKRYDAFSSVKNGVEFQDLKLTERPVVNGTELKSFKDFLAEESKNVLETSDSIVANKEDLPKTDEGNSEETSEVYKALSAATFNTLYYSAPSYFDILRGKIHLLRRWADVDTLIEKSSTNAFLRYEVQSTPLEIYYDRYYSDTYADALSTKKVNLARSGLNQFSSHDAYYKYEDSEKALLLGIVEDVLSIKNNSTDDLKVLPNADKLAEIACESNFIDRLTAKESCVVDAKKGAASGLKDVSDSLYRFIKTAFSTNAIRHENETLRTGEVSSEVSQKLFEIVLNAYDFGTLSVDDNEISDRRELISGMGLITTLISRPAEFDSASFNDAKLSKAEELLSSIALRLGQLEGSINQSSTGEVKNAILEKDRLIDISEKLINATRALK